jgi:hypothetical protein
MLEPVGTGKTTLLNFTEERQIAVADRARVGSEGPSA